MKEHFTGEFYLQTCRVKLADHRVGDAFVSFLPETK